MATWIRSHREASITPRAQRTNAALSIYRRTAEQYLNEHSATIACDADEPSTIHGWACGQTGALHYVYVPKGLRCMGLGRELIERAVGGYPMPLTVTHRWPWPSKRFVLREEGEAA